jgi:1-acyl-sn-glycerol-3-phosphate acyltransferase
MAPSSRLNLFWRLLAALARLIVSRIERWRLDITGLEHVPTTGGAVLAFNHHSYFDFVMVAWAIVLQRRRPVRFLAKREIWRSRAGIVVRAAGAVPVDRDDATSRHGAYAAAVAALRRGELVAVAPEQTISPSVELLPFRTGAARMAQAAGVPIVPVVGWGSHRFASKGRGLRHVPRIPVVVRYLQSLSTAGETDPVQLTRRLEAIMTAALTEVQDAYPDRAVPDDDWWVPARLGGSAPAHATVLAEHQRRFEARRGRGGAT